MKGKNRRIKTVERSRKEQLTIKNKRARKHKKRNKGKHRTLLPSFSFVKEIYMPILLCEVGVS